MIFRFRIPRLALLVLPLLIAACAAQAAPLQVVASFSILGDMVHQIGGERVAVTTLVGPDADVHVYQPSPRDAQAVANAAVLVINGLGLEGWMQRLIDSAHFHGQLVVASTGVVPLQGSQAGPSGDRPVTDPHAWQSLVDGKIYVANIRDGLIAADPAGRSIYEANAARFLAAIDALDGAIKAQVARIPPERRRIITTHDAFAYFGAEYGLTLIAPEGVSTDSEPSAREVALIIRQIKRDHIPAIFLENVSDPRLLDQIAADTGAKIGGALYSDALSPPDGPAPTYLAMVRHNIAVLAAALAP